MNVQEAELLFERSKYDNEIIVGSEIRALAQAYIEAMGEIERLRSSLRPDVSSPQED